MKWYEKLPRVAWLGGWSQYWWIICLVFAFVFYSMTIFEGGVDGSLTPQQQDKEFFNSIPVFVFIGLIITLLIQIDGLKCNRQTAEYSLIVELGKIRPRWKIDPISSHDKKPSYEYGIRAIHTVDHFNAEYKIKTYDGVVKYSGKLNKRNYSHESMDYENAGGFELIIEYRNQMGIREIQYFNVQRLNWDLVKIESYVDDKKTPTHAIKC